MVGIPHSANLIFTIMTQIEIFGTSFILGGSSAMAVSFFIEFFTSYKSRVKRYLSYSITVMAIVIWYAITLHMAIHHIGDFKLTEKREERERI